jgi:Na+-transporting NADH:ubiquinone oxidoreductase subunit NqrC
VNRLKPWLIAALVVLLAFGCVLATHALLRGRIESNERLGIQRALLSALGIHEGSEARERVVSDFAARVSASRLGEFGLWEWSENGATRGYGFEIRAKGPGGPIRAALALSADRHTLLGLEIFEHREGDAFAESLGDAGWKARLRGLPVFSNSAFLGVSFGEKKKGSGASPAFDELGGAINRTLARFYAGGRVVEELDFKISSDAVTRATPGYPKHVVKPPNLRDEVKRPAFMVPPGIRLLSIGAKVATSSPPVLGELSQLTDGVKKCGDFDIVEMGKGPQWAQVDLGAEHPVFGICVWHSYRNAIIYNDVIVQISSDNFESDVRTVFNNDWDNSAGFGAGKDTSYYARWWGELIDTRGERLEGTTARWVRVYTAGGAGGEETRFVEIAVYGK